MCHTPENRNVRSGGNQPVRLYREQIDRELVRRVGANPTSAFCRPGGKFTDEQRNLYLRLLERDLASLPDDKDVKRFYNSVMDLVTENLTDGKQLDPNQEGNGCS